MTFKYFRELVVESPPRPHKVGDPLAKPQNLYIQVTLFGNRARPAALTVAIGIIMRSNMYTPVNIPLAKYQVA